ncbi:MAG: hypothetical protein SGARI_001366 [Bacillariaceae sp.]
MPTFPNRYAGCSGSMEEGECPWETARRELQEESNWTPASPRQWEEPASAGLYVDVDFVWSGKSSIIRVYPFVVSVPSTFEVQLKGTEHDRWQWMGLDELETLDDEDKTVPSLARAFHHATAGKFDTRATEEERAWASDKENGASTMSRNALQLLMTSKTADPARLAMLRPSMVTIVNCMKVVQKLQSTQQSTRPQAAQQVLDALDRETKLSVQYAVDALQTLYRDNSREGEIMANDLNDCGKETTAVYVEDDEMKDLIGNNEIDVLLVGADCVLADRSAVANKVGTANLAAIATNSTCQVLCCTDRFKLWDDVFPPPLETDLFEMVHVKDHAVELLLPPPPTATKENT